MSNNYIIKTSDTSNPKVSVIVPIYNREKYIARCIDSILRQTFMNFELILVDDGSKDRSLAICEEYAKKDERIVVLHKENGGVSSARNLGIDKARGKWICFVDSDDYVTEYYIQHLAELVGKYEDDSALFVSGILRDGKIAKALENKIYKVSELKDGIIVHNGPVSKLFRQSIIKDNDIRFPVGITSGEDFVFTVNYLLYVNIMVTTAHYDYIYYLSETSVTRLDRSTLRFPQEWNNFRCMREIWELFMDKYNIVDRNNSLWHSGVETRLHVYVTSYLYLPTFAESYNGIYSLYNRTNDLKGYITYADAQGKLSQISRFFLRHKMLRCYVLFNRLMIKTGRVATV